MNIRIIPLLATIAAALAAGCTPANRLVENPLIEASNTLTIDIAKVELSDTATVLHVNASYTPHRWIRIASGSYLQADGRKYPLAGAEGITPDSLLWMPDSGRASFALRFGALPRATKSFDFIESDCDDCYKLWGIDLTGRKEYARYPEGLPRQLRQEPQDGPLPEPQLAVGETTVNVHLLGYRPGMARKLALYVDTILSDQEEKVVQVDTASGTATFRFLQSGPVQAIVAGQRQLGTLWLAPGETTEVYIDMRGSGMDLVRWRLGRDEAGPAAELYTTGTYAALNRLWSRKRSIISLDAYDANFADYQMTGDEYAEMVMTKYKLLADSIARSEQPEMMREMELLCLRQEALAVMANCRYFLENNYRVRNNFWRGPLPEGAVTAELTPEHYAAFGALFDAGDPKLLMGGDMPEYLRAVSAAEIDWTQYGASDDVIRGIRTIVPLKRKIQNLEVTEDDLETLHALKEPFFAEACETVLARNRALIEALEGKMRIELTPDVPVAKLFEAIVAPHRGKVVLVDIWNTWCGPCRSAIADCEPLKDTELKNDDLVWIYIANETSPFTTYRKMIADIRGLHYRLNEEQWRYLCDERFDIDGIPSYIVVDRSGKAELRNDLRDHDGLKRVLLDKLGQ